MNIGMLLLAIWLIASGLVSLIPALSGLGLVLAVLAIAAGIFILLGRQVLPSNPTVRSTATGSPTRWHPLDNSIGEISCCGLSS